MKTKAKSPTRDAFNKGIEIEPIIDIPIDENDSIEQMFKNEQNANQDNVKELFHEEKVKARTDISPRQVKLITKAYLMGKLTGIKDINSVLKVKYDDEGFISTNEVIEIRNELTNLIGYYE